MKSHLGQKHVILAAGALCGTRQPCSALTMHEHQQRPANEAEQATALTKHHATITCGQAAHPDKQQSTCQ